jgi:large subunit ribosomal protein L24
MKKTREVVEEGIVKKEAPLHVSKVMLLDQKTNRPTRVRIEEKDGVKVRVAVKSGTVFD